MTNPYIFGGLSRAVNDPTTVDQAISIAVQAHDDEPNAHLEAGQSLTTHRAAQIIDHLAESVVNDKIATIARYFTAIVDPSDPNSYDSIQGALTFAYANGFGNIYIAPGTHYFTGNLIIDPRISIYGGGVGETIILPQTDNLQALQFQCSNATIPTGQFTCTLRDLTIGSTARRVNSSQTDADIAGEFINVNFAGIGTSEFRIGAFGGKGQINLSGCQIHTDGISGSIYIAQAHYVDCAFYTKTTDGVCVDLTDSILDHCIFNIEGTATRGKYIYATDNYNIIRDCHFFNCSNVLPTNTMYNGVAKNIFINNAFELIVTATLNISQANTIFVNNTVLNGTPVNLTVSANNCIITGNALNGTVTDSGAGNIIDNNTPELPYKLANIADTAMAFSLRKTVKLTPNSTRTLTTTIPNAGKLRTLIILTSGVSSFILTFGTGFKANGTLTTGTVSARYFMINFVSDGINLFETSRTVAIA